MLIKDFQLERENMDGRRLIINETNLLITENLDVSELTNDQLRASIIIPAHNEIEVIKKNLEKVIECISRIFVDYQIIIAEDGSNDGTDTAIKELAETNSRITYLHFDVRLGKGQALKRSFKLAKEKVVAFMDADLAANVEHLTRLVQMIQEGFIMAIGSRAVEGSKVKRPHVRKIASKLYNLLVRILFRDGIHDHQCGFKAFNRDLIIPILDEVKDNEFFFDTELIIRTQNKGHSIIEVPVKWEEPEGRESKFQLANDGMKILIRLLKLRIDLWKG